MKKIVLLLLLLPSILLTSCTYGFHPYNLFVDADYNLRVIQYREKRKYLAVDEYYYNDDKYDGEITIDITIPESINGLPVKHFGREVCVEILTDNEVKYEHDSRGMGSPSNLIEFAIICFSYFEEGTVINVNIDIQADLEDFKLFHYDYLWFFNNNDLFTGRYDPSITYYEPECNLNISIVETSTKYYSIDGEVYERSDDGEDKKITTKHPEIFVDGNLLDNN